jgi:hypothetical protein
MPDRHGIRVALAAALLREGVATTTVSERTEVPFALVEFLAEHPEQPERPDIAAGYVDPARPWATMAISTPQQRTAPLWPRVRLFLAVSLNLALTAFSHSAHRPVLALVCLFATLPAIVIALCYPPAPTHERLPTRTHPDRTPPGGDSVSTECCE